MTVPTESVAGLEDRVTDVQIRLTYQESDLQELSLTVLRQQRTIDDLRKEIAELRRMLVTLAEMRMENPAQEPPPPHY